MRNTTQDKRVLDAAALTRRIQALDQMEIDAIRREWVRVVKTNPHLRLSADLLQRGIAHRLQEAASGGYPASISKRLAQAAGWGGTAVKTSVALKAGATLVREWHGRAHTVRVIEDGYEYDGRHFASLTSIAREITGVAWSGPRFFGTLKVPIASAAQARGSHA